jgi:hypothetical protein
MKNIIYSITVLIVLVIFTEICGFCFWKAIYPDPGNVFEVLIASLYTTRLIILPILLFLIIIRALKLKDIIKFKGITISILTLMILIALFFWGSHYYVKKNNIISDKIIHIITWPNNNRQ